MQPKLGRAFRYQFQLTLHQLDVEIPFPCWLQFHWSRTSNKKVSTVGRIEVKGHQKVVQINSNLTLCCTCFLKESLDFVEKKSVVSVTLYINGEARSGGHISLDLSSILNPLSYKTPSHKEFDKVLEKSVLKNSRLKFGVKAVYVKEMLQEELGQIQRQQSTSVASSNPKSINSLASLNINSVDSFNFKDFGNLLEGDSSSLHSLKNDKEREKSKSKQSHSQSSSKRRLNLNSEASDDYELSQKHKQSVYRLQAQNTQLRMFLEEQECKINKLLEQGAVEKQQYEGKIIQLTETNFKIEQRQLELKKELEKQQCLVANFAEQIKHLEELMKTQQREHHQEMSQLRIQNNELQTIITKQELSFQALEVTTAGMKLSENRISSQLRVKELLIHELQTKFANASMLNVDLEKQIGETLKSNIQVQLDLKLLREQDASVADVRVNEAKRRIVALEGDLAECEQIIAVLKKETKEKKMELAVQEEKVRVLEEVLGNREKDIEGLDKALKESDDKVKGIEAKVKSLKESIKKYQEFIREKEAENNRILEQLQKSKLSITHLNKLLEQNSLSSSLHSQQINKYQARIHQLSSSLAQLQDSQIPLTSHLSSLEAHNKTLAKTNELLLEQLAKYKQQTLHQATKNESHWVEKVEVLENQIKRRDTKIAKIEMENRQLEEDNIKLNLKIMRELGELQRKHGSGGGTGSSQNSGVFREGGTS